MLKREIEEMTCVRQRGGRKPCWGRIAEIMSSLILWENLVRWYRYVEPGCRLHCNITPIWTIALSKNRFITCRTPPGGRGEVILYSGLVRLPARTLVDRHIFRATSRTCAADSPLWHVFLPQRTVLIEIYLEYVSLGCLFCLFFLAALFEAHENRLRMRTVTASLWRLNDLLDCKPNDEMRIGGGPGYGLAVRRRQQGNVVGHDMRKPVGPITCRD